jgi:hypothetical protein
MSDACRVTGRDAGAEPPSFTRFHAAKKILVGNATRLLTRSGILGGLASGGLLQHLDPHQRNKLLIDLDSELRQCLDDVLCLGVQS